MNRKLTASILAFSMVFSAAVFSGCSLFGDDEETVESEQLKREMSIEDNDFDNPTYKYEGDGEEPMTVPHDEKDYVGLWTATSNRAEYLWGNVDLKINEDGTWKGNVTEETFTGKWVYTKKDVIIKDKEGFIYWRLFFADDGNLMFENMEEPGDPLVLEKKGK